MTDRRPPQTMVARTRAGDRALDALESIRPRLEQIFAGPEDSATLRAAVLELQVAGLLSACATEEGGGLGLVDLYDVCLVVRALGRISGSLAVALSMHFALSCYFSRRTTNIPSGGDPATRFSAWLRLIGQGQMVVASAVAEAGAEIWQPRTEGRLTGSTWTIDGTKSVVSLSPSATHFYARFKAHVGGQDLIGSAMIEAKTPGVKVIDDWDGLGLRSSGSGRVRFEGVRVASDQVHLGAVWGVNVASDYFGRAAASIPILSAYVGLLDRAYVEGAAAYRAKADARGGTLGAATTTAAAEMVLHYDSIVALVEDASARVADGFAAHYPGDAPDSLGASLMRQCVTTALWVERTGDAVVKSAMQLTGGRSFGAAHPLAQIRRDLAAGEFMRPYSPADGWADYLANCLKSEVGVPLR